MFRREDYWPYMFGVFVFAGLLAVPLIWGQFIDLPYDRLVAGSLVGCFVFAYAHTRDGQFSFGRFIVGFGFVFLISLRAAARSGGIGGFIPGGVVGFLVMGGCGWLGIGIARAVGISEALKTPDPTVLPTHDDSVNSDAQSIAKPTKTPIKETPPRYSFTETELRRLLQRTQEAWNSGALAHYSEGAKNSAAGKTHEDFAKLFKPALNAIAFAFMHTPPEENEYLIMAYDAQTQLSFVLTNKYLYFFGLDQGFLANKYETGKVALHNVQSCTLNEGWVSDKAQLKLKSGKTLSLKSLPPEPIKYIMKLLEARESAS